MVTGQMGARARHQSRQASHEVHGLKQHVGGAIAEGMLEFIHHQPVPIDARAFQGNGWSSHISADSLELLSLLGPARHGSPRPATASR